MNKAFKQLLRLAVGFLILFLLVRDVGFSNLVSVFRTFDLRYLLIFVGVALLTVFIATINLAILMIPLKKYIPLPKMCRYYLLSWSLGMFIPGKLGELSIIYFFHREGVTVGEASAVAILDKLITFISLLLLALLSLSIYFSWNLLGILIAAFALSILLTWTFIVWDKGRQFLVDRLLKKGHHMFRGFSRSFKIILFENKNAVVANFGLTLIKWAVNAIGIVALFVSFGARPSYWSILVITAILTLTGLIPITINGLGVKQAAAIFFFGMMGIGEDVVLATFLVSMVLNYLLSAVTLMLFWSEVTKMFAEIKNKLS